MRRAITERELVAEVSHGKLVCAGYIALRLAYSAISRMELLSQPCIAYAQHVHNVHQVHEEPVKSYALCVD